MTTYAILLPGDEASWERATPDLRPATDAEHERFSRTPDERAHPVDAVQVRAATAGEGAA